MQFRPPWLLLAAALQVCLLSFLAHGGEAPTIRPAEAAAYEGQGEVRLVGLVTHVRASDDSTRVTLEAAGHRLDVLVRGESHPSEGAWVEAQGRVARLAGVLTLVVQDASRLAVAAPAGVARPSWSDLAHHPGDWAGLPIEVEGQVQRGLLRDGDGHNVALGAGPWPKEGAVRVVGALGYEPACLCHRLAAIEVTALGTAWTR